MKILVSGTDGYIGVLLAPHLMALVEYLHRQAYSPECYDGFRFVDRAAGIHWPLPLTSISNQDLA